MESDLPVEEVQVDSAALEPPLGEPVENGDGTTTIYIDSNEANPTDDGWFSDLSLTLSEAELDTLAIKYLDLIDNDLDDRKDRDRMQADGLKKAGLGDPAPGGAGFEGASRVTHPVLIESYIDFSSSAIKELFPPNGPVRAKVEGKPNKKKLDRARRKGEFMNWELTQKIKPYRSELEKLLTQLPVGGSQYMKIYWDESKGWPNVEFVPIDDMVLPYEARTFYDLQRKFHRMRVSDFEYQRRVDSGYYRDLSLPAGYVGQEDETESKRQTDKIEGKRNNYTSDTGERIINEGCVFDIIDGDDKAPKDRACPYLITIDEDSRKVLSLYRNWDEDDKTAQELEYIVDFNFIPWRGVYALNLLQCLAGLPDALTGSLRALLDSALINSMPGGLKLKSQQGGASLSIAPTQITEVDSMGQDDIRKLYMPIPFNPPSPILYQLLGFLSDKAQGVVGTAEEKISDASNNMPVGTTLALIEQGAKVFSAIHTRLHDSQRRCLEILHRLNRDHLPDQIQYGSDPEDIIMRADFEGPMDVHPVSDPNIFSEAQRFAQIQFVLSSLTQTAQVLPQVAQLFNMRELYAHAFEMAKIPDYEDFLPPIVEAKPLNPVDENIAMVMGKPVKAFLGQNHEAHIQVLLDFAQNPLFGKSPIIASQFGTAALNHLQDHLLVWYEEMMKLNASQTIGGSADQIDWDTDPSSAIELAKSAPVVDRAAQIAFAKIPELVAQGMQMLQAMAPKPPVDPMVQVMQSKIQGDQQNQQGKLSLAQQKATNDAQMKMAVLQEKLQAATQDYHIQLQKAGIDSQTQIQQSEIESKTELAKTLHDNQTAENIADKKIHADKATRLSNGGGLDDH